VSHRRAILIIPPGQSKLKKVRQKCALGGIGKGRPVNRKAEEMLKQMTHDQWENINSELKQYARRRGSRHFYRGGRDVLPNGDSFESLPNTAIQKLFSGARDWDPDQRPDLLTHLKSIVKSLVSHSVESFDNRRLVAEPEEPESYDEQGWAERQYYEMAACRYSGLKDPLATLLEKERQFIADRALGLLVSECKDDRIALAMIALRQEGITKPAILAKKLGIEPKQIYAASKRLDRRFIAVAESIKQELAGGVAPSHTKRNKIISLDVVEAIAGFSAEVELTDDEACDLAA
jgi:hypothetical protein